MRRGLPIALGLAFFVACGSDPDSSSSSSGSPSGGPPEALFATPSSLDQLRDETFFDHPFPSDLRVDADGTARFAGFPNPKLVPLLGQYVSDTKGLFRGFSPNAAAYLRFTNALDPASLPADPSASLANDAAVQIVDVDPASPEKGQRHLAQVYFHAPAGVYWASNTLAVRPMIGRPLRPKTKYAVVVTKKARAVGSADVVVSDALARIVGTKPVTDATRAAHDAFAPAIAELAKAGIPADDIRHLTVYTTNDPTEEVFAAVDDTLKAVPAPTAKDWKRTDEDAAYDVYEGNYGPSPNFQAGTAPFKKPSDGGGFQLENGRPKLQGTFDLRFALAVPNAATCPMPAGGYPITLYAHGTGGDYRSFVDDGTARSLAQKCIASMGIDQIFHGTRPGAPPLDDPQRETNTQLLFFNLDNPLAARTSNRQSGIDVVQQARLFTETKAKVPAGVSKTTQEIAFDGTRMTFFGHSQGGLNGPIFLAATNQARGGVLSGAGSDISLNLLEKTKPIDVAAAFRFLVGLGDAEEAKELNELHPVLHVAQSLVDASDPVHYAPYIIRAPRPGNAPKSIYQTEGVKADGDGDSYAPPHGIEALSVSLGLPRMAPGVREIAEAKWAGLGDVSVPPGGLSGNLANGAASGVLAQFVPPAGRDGHFVVFNVPAARAQAAGFVKNLSDDPKGRVPAP
ncbi:MAG: hypothetical protein JST00_09070 [Deltaproteobacteria bacterium]|nr:hypothetical protein [Deltaproteobacteria bacterium]